MRKLVLSFFLLPLLMPGSAAGQSDSQSRSVTARVSTVSGQVSPDGRSVIPKNGDSWLVANPGALAGHEGQQVKVKCQISSSAHQIHVLSVKIVATQTRYAVNLGDSAFRR